MALTVLFPLSLVMPVTAGALDSNSTNAGGAVQEGIPSVAVVYSASGSVMGSVRPRGGSGRRWHCRYYDMLGIETGTSPEQEKPATNLVAGQLYGLICLDDANRWVYSRVVAWNPAEPLGPLFAAERAADLAISRLPLPNPRLGVNPPASRPLLVGLPTWYWLANPLRPLRTSATAGGVTATVTAQPTGATFDPGDGTGTISCPDGGTAYDNRKAPQDQHSSCRHTYQWVSARSTVGTWNLTATVTYRVTWAATNGQTGDLGTLTRSSTVPLVVTEANALIH